MSEARRTDRINDVLQRLRFIRKKKQEYLICPSFDASSRLVARRTVTIGTLTCTIIHPREVFAGPIKDRASHIIIAQNHLSGIAKPSGNDIETTQHIVATGIILGIQLYDHIIVSKDTELSFRKGNSL